MKTKIVGLVLGLSLLTCFLAACNQEPDGTGRTGIDATPSPGGVPAESPASYPSPSPTSSPY
jgi:hypothetical protein